ncbi:MAG: BGTF surface domain-containing protein [Halobaculum sp.]
MPPSSPSRFTPLAAVCLLVVTAVVAGVPGSVIATESGVSQPSAVSESAAGSDASTAPATCRTGSATAASEAATVDRTSHDTAPIPNESRDTTVARGDLAVVPLSVPAGSNVTVAVESVSGYSARLGVGDDGDGTVRLVVNTYLAGNRSSVDPDAYAVGGNDTLSVLGGNASVPFEPGEYTVTVERNGSFVGERSLTVTEPVVGNVTAYRAVPRLFDAKNGSVVSAANQSGLTAPLLDAEYAPEVVRGETLVVRIDAPSLLGLIAAQSGETTTDRVAALSQDVGPSTPVGFYISGPCGGVLFDETLTAGGVRAVVDHTNGSVFLLFDTANLEGFDAGTQSLSFYGADETWVGAALNETEFQFGLTEAIPSPYWTVEKTLSASENATISGTTRLLPGSRVTVTLSSRVDPTFDRTVQATVGPNGTFSVALDLSTLTEPNRLVGTVAGRNLRVTVGEYPNIEWSLSGPDPDDSSKSIHAERFDLDGGFLVVYEIDLENGTYEGVGVVHGEDDYVPVGTDESPRRFFVVAHRDGDGDGEFDGIETDPPYRIGGATGGDASLVGDWLASTNERYDAPDAAPPPFDTATVTFEPWVRETETPTPATATTTTPPPTGATPSGTEPSATARSTATAEEPPGTRTTTGTPGFGAAVAPTALLAAVAVLLGRRREN